MHRGRLGSARNGSGDDVESGELDATGPSTGADGTVGVGLGDDSGGALATSITMPATVGFAAVAVQDNLAPRP